MIQDEILAAYSRHGSIKGVHKATGYSEGLIRKTLVTAGLYTSPRAEEVQALAAQGLREADIAEQLGISKGIINTYLPYSKGTYLNEEKTENAQRIRACRARKKEQAE